MTALRIYVVHLRTLLAALAVPLFIGCWWWATVFGPAPDHVPAGTQGAVRVVIDPGHGGVDPGAVGRSGVLEKDVVLEVALKLARLFEEFSIDAVLIRDKDVDFGGGTGTLREQKRADLSRRVDLANESGADAYISLHANSFPSARWSGAQTFYYPGKAEGEELAVAIQSELLKVDPQNTRQARPGEYYVLERTAMPAVVVELGFLSHPQEEKLLQDPDYQLALAEAIFRGVVRFLLRRVEAQGEEEEEALSRAGATGRAPGEGRLWAAQAPPPGEFFLYFRPEAAGSDGLTALAVPFPAEAARAPLAERMRHALDRLVAGPPAGSGLLPVAPPGVQVLSLRLEGGTARVALSSGESESAWGGGTSEALFVESLVRTLGQFPGVEEVAIDAGDGALFSHVDPSRPFRVLRSERP